VDRPTKNLRPARDGRRGVSLPELLVVISILALGVMISIPLIADRVQRGKVRSAASQYAVALRAARMIAVANQRPVSVNVQPDPANAYSYTDRGGKLRETELPSGVWIDAGDSSPAVVFARDGSLAEAAKTVIASKLSGGRTEVWTVDIPVTGIPQVRHEIEGESEYESP
jgi:prepilin-type N-terminal cleavage/methylation domain-containing protein